MATILIVDDEENIRFIMGYVLGSSHTVIQAATGPEGLEKYVDLKPDLLITDINLPGMTGLELIKEVRRLNSEAKIIATTGTNYLTNLEMKQIGADICFSKPVSISDLEEAISQLL